MSDDAYNDGYTHEALHTTFVLMETFADYVLDTRCAAEFPEVKAAAELAHQALFDLYQLIGTKMGASAASHQVFGGPVK